MEGNKLEEDGWFWKYVKEFGFCFIGDSKLLKCFK